MATGRSRRSYCSIMTIVVVTSLVWMLKTWDKEEEASVLEDRRESRFRLSLTKSLEALQFVRVTDGRVLLEIVTTSHG